MNRRRSKIWIECSSVGLILAGSLFMLLSFAPQEEIPPIKGRMVIIGIDGLSWTPVLPLMKERLMPNLAMLMQKGSYGDIKADRPARTTHVWTTIATGVRTEKHGITSRYRRDRAGDRMTLSTEWLYPPVWRRLSERHVSVLVVGWPVTWPAQPVYGSMISDLFFPPWGNLSQQELDAIPFRCYPASLSDEIKYFGGRGKRNCAALLHQEHDEADENLTSIFNRSMESDAATAEVALGMLHKSDAAVTMLYLGGFHPVMKASCQPIPDDVSNMTARKDPDGETRMMIDEHYRHTLNDYLAFIDTLIGRFIRTLGPHDTIMILSGRGIVEGSIDNVINDPLVSLPFGLFVFAGPDIKQYNRPVLGGTREIAPTILYLAGFPIDISLDGGVMMLALDEQLSFHQRVEYEGDSVE